MRRQKQGLRPRGAFSRHGKLKGLAIEIIKIIADKDKDHLVGIKRQSGYVMK